MRQILHFGPGNFFRAHLAEYAFDAGGWGITAVSLRSPDLTDGLAKQGGAYTLAVMGRKAKQIDVINDVLNAPLQPDAVFQRLREVEIISATVTEKGYYLGSDGTLDLDAPDIAADLQSEVPGTLIGWLARGLAARVTPVTVLSCDNRTGNGDALGAAVQRFADAAGLEIACDLTFPNAMVDRITPATTDALRAQTSDSFAVPCEPFKEWVIEDRFATPRPDWPGVQWVKHVAPHELRKLRMLNGAHSFLAYSGVLEGYEFVHQAVGDPDLRAQVTSLMEEAARTLPEAVRAQAPDYAAALLARFDNPHIQHKLRQIAMDGTQKLPYRILAPLRDIGPPNAPTLLSAVKAWVAFCEAETEAGRAVEDPKSAAIGAAKTGADLLRLIDATDLMPL